MSICYLWYPQVTLHLVSNKYSLLQVASVVIVVTYKNLPLYLYIYMVQNVNLYSYKKDSHVN